MRHGAAKMWMARLYPTYEPTTCLISNGLATMAFSLPGAIAAKLVHPERKVLAATGDEFLALLLSGRSAKGYRIASAGELFPTLRKALDDAAVSLIACPVDYAENTRLVARLGELERSM